MFQFVTKQMKENLTTMGYYMGVFGDFAMKYYEAGYSVMPVNGKDAFINDFQRFSENLPTQKEIETYESKYPDCNIGMILGLNDLICVDIDYDGEYRDEFVKSIVASVMPENETSKSFVAKKGAKGLSFFCRGKMGGKKIKNPNNKEDKRPVVEILSKGNYTVLPPSIHPEIKSEYIWTTPENLLDVDITSLIEITDKDINNIRSTVNYFFENFSKRKKPGRNNALGAFVFRSSKDCKTIDELVELTIKYDDFKNGHNSYFRDTKENHGESHTSFAKKFVERAIDWLKKDKAKRGIVWELGFDESSDQYDIYKQFFSKSLNGVKKCKFRNTVYFQDKDGRFFPLENKIKTIQSLAISSKIDHTKIEIHLSRWMDEIEPTLLVDIEPWDGKPRILNMLNHIEPLGLDKKYFNEIMLEWISGIFKRVENNKFQNFCPLLCGAQGLGKDTFLENLFSGLGDYFTNISINENEEKNFQNIFGKIVCNIPEFDKASKAHPAIIKNLITSPKQTMRFPYDRKSIDAYFHASFIGSANTDEVLFDSSGARRFAVLRLADIDFSYPKDEGKELLSEMIHLSEVGFNASKEAWDEVNKTLEELTPDTEDGLKEAIKYEWIKVGSEVLKTLNLTNSKNHEYLTQAQAYEIILHICKKFGFSQFRIRNVLKAMGFQKKTKLNGETFRFWYVNDKSSNINANDLSGCQRVTEFVKRVNVRNHLEKT